MTCRIQDTLLPCIAIHFAYAPALRVAEGLGCFEVRLVLGFDPL